MNNIKVKNSPKVLIAYLISSLTKQGPVQVLLDIVTHIDWSKFEVIIIVLKKEENNSLQSFFDAFPLKIKRLDIGSKFNLLKLLKQLKRVIISENIHILHSHCFRSLLLNRLQGHLAISFHTIHIYPGYQTKAKNGFLSGRILTFLTKRFIKRIKYSIACSKSVAEELKLKDNINVLSITNGISVKQFPRESKLKLKKLLGLDHSIKYFISVGRFSPEKNFKLLVQAFMDSNLDGAKLIILGDGKMFHEIKRISNENIILPGFKCNVADYLRVSDFYIALSLTEGMPLSVLEAMSHGLPLLLSDILPHREILNTISDVEIGLLIPFNEVRAITETIKSASNNRDMFNSNHIKQAFTSHFTSLRMSNEYQDTYLKSFERKK